MTDYFCTMGDLDYLDRVVAMHQSMEQHCRPYHMWILALDRGAEQVLSVLNLPNVTVVPMGLVETSELRAVKDTRLWFQYVWTTKSHWLLYLLSNLHLNQVTYLDGDGYFFSSIRQVLARVQGFIGIVSHRFSPAYSHCWCNGHYNAGFIHLKRCEKTFRLLYEWTQQCREFALGPLTDQIRMTQWPGKWGAEVITHKGVDLAPWNWEQYNYSLRDGQVFVDEVPLIWYHFHRGLEPVNMAEDAWVRPHVYQPYANALASAKVQIAQARPLLT